jgi:hypothetical protein
MSELPQMHQCIVKVTGMPSNSSSATDTWICSLKNGTKFHGNPCTHTFLKIGIVDGSNGSERLAFECLVYDRVITPILDAQICPNFLRSYLTTNKCTYGNLVDTLRVGLPDLKIDQIHRRLNRNLRLMANYKSTHRPAIESAEHINKADNVARIKAPSNTRVFLGPCTLLVLNSFGGTAPLQMT